MSSDSHATITYTSMSSYEVIVNGYFGMPMDPLDLYVQLVIKAPPSPEYIPGPEAPPSPDYIPGPEYPEYLPPADDVLPAEEQPLPAAVSPTVESPGYITNSEPEMEPEEEDGDDEKSEGDSIEYPTSRGDDDDDDLSEDYANEEESSDNEEEDEEHLALTVPAPALHSSIPAPEDSDETEPFEEGETATTPPPFGYRVAARISVQPYILMPFCSELEVERLLAIPTPPLSPVSPTSYPLPPFLMPLHIFTPLPPPLPIVLPRTRAPMVLMRSATPSTFILAPRSRTPPLLPIPLPTSSFPLPLLLPSTFSSKTDSRRAEDRLIGRLRRERRYFRTLFTTYAKEVAHSRDYCTQIIDYCQSREEAINNLIAQRVTEALAEYETQRNSVVNGDTSHTTGTGPRTVRPTRECTYKDYLNCGPLKFNGTEGVIGLTRWFERTESNSHMRAVSQEVTYTMPWKTLKQMMTTKYCPRGEVKKLEVELWNLKESDEIERYVGGLPEMIRGNVMSYEPKSMQKAIEFANDQWIKNSLGLPIFKRKTKGSLTILQGTNKTNNHSKGTIMLHGPMLQGLEKNHTEEPNLYCRSRAANTNNNNNNNNYNNRRATSAYQGVPTCFEYGAQGHFKNNCPKLGNRNQGNQNQTGNGNDVARAYGLGTQGGNPDANVVTELGSFDVIIGMDWLKTYHAVIVFDEKIVCVPFGNETLIIRCDGSNNENQLNIISCTKTRKCLLKGYPVFLANITTKMIKDKSEEKRLEDMPIV
uniref:Reverse transcriptase domain-containing protein n=1 Tax=Tanacetum cinerariifolium TaxID=118510 RepID=A0A6L2NXK4_TANCI|nr:hypothetical protein [Tanacetum cinerariifolium]